MTAEHRFPTILGLLVIVVSLVTVVFLFKNIRSLVSQATPDATPTEVKITNISESSFTVSWITAGHVSGTINFSEDSSLGNVATDDRDQISGTTGQYQTHHLTLRYLKPASQYYFKIISGGTTFDNNGEPYIVTTAPQISTTPGQISPAYGMVTKTDGSPASGAIVYLNLDRASPLSTLVKSSGSWLITINNARTTDLADYIKITGSEKLTIFVQAGGEDTAQATTTVANDSPVPQITLGKNLDLNQMALASPTASPGAGFKPPAASFAPSLTSPASGSAVPSDRPVFGGTGIPGKTVVIKIQSAQSITGTTSVDQNGNWTWTPPSGLSPGEHTVTITTTDNAGNPVNFSRKFIVLASGTQVTEPATPSATPKTSPSPSPTSKPSPTLKPTPTPLTSTAPASGNPTPTMIVLIIGLSLVTLGLGQFLFRIDKL